MLLAGEKLAGEGEDIVPDLSLQIFEEFLLESMDMRLVSFHVDFASVVVHKGNRDESLARVVT